MDEPDQWHVAGVDLRFVLLAEPGMLSQYYPKLADPMVYWSTKLIFFGAPVVFWIFAFPFRWFGFYREMKLSSLLLSLFSIGLTIFLSESTLRLVEYYPGQISRSRWFRPVDELVALQGFSTDSQGIFKVDTEFSSFLEKTRTVNECHFLDLVNSPMEHGYVAEITSVYRQHHGIYTSDQQLKFWDQNCRAGKFSGQFHNGQSSLEKLFVSTIEKTEYSDFDSLIYRYVVSPINSEGFYSVPFEHCKGRTKVLLIGDSFTYGHSAESLGNSFSNILLSKGYLVYNTGISGADVAQYLAVAEKYIDQLKPDVVIMNFFVGNDVAWHERTPKPETPLFYATNAGNLLCFQKGREQRNMNSAYEGIMAETSIPRTGIIDNWLSKTVLGTFFWKVVVAKLPVLKSGPMDSPVPKDVDFCYETLNQISAICDSNHVDFILSVIPELVDGNLVGAESYPMVFRDLNVFEAKLSPEMYNRDDGHFNELGHAVYAKQLHGLLGGN